MFEAVVWKMPGDILCLKEEQVFYVGIGLAGHPFDRSVQLPTSPLSHSNEALLLDVDATTLSSSASSAASSSSLHSSPHRSCFTVPASVLQQDQQLLGWTVQEIQSLFHQPSSNSDVSYRIIHLEDSTMVTFASLVHDASYLKQCWRRMQFSARGTFQGGVGGGVGGGGG